MRFGERFVLCDGGADDVGTAGSLHLRGPRGHKSGETRNRTISVCWEAAQKTC